MTYWFLKKKGSPIKVIHDQHSAADASGNKAAETGDSKEEDNKSEVEILRDLPKLATKSNSVFAVVCSATPELRNIKFFATKAGAQTYLKSLADERRHKFGVHCFEENEDKFSYLLGWEEHSVSFSIKELAIQ